MRNVSEVTSPLTSLLPRTKWCWKPTSWLTYAATAASANVADTFSSSSADAREAGDASDAANPFSTSSMATPTAIFPDDIHAETSNVGKWIKFCGEGGIDDCRPLIPFYEAAN